MGKLTLLLVLCVCIAGSLQSPRGFRNVDHLIEYINNANTTWKAGKNFDDSYSLEYVRGLMGVRRPEGPLDYVESAAPVHSGIDIPDEFDPRVKWPECKSLSEIRDQGSCGGCWAFSSVEAMTDRLCIASKGKQQAELSGEDMVACSGAGGCGGGWPASAYGYYIRSGLVSGGLYDSHEGCQPYTIASCEHYITGQRPPCHKHYDPTPKCQHLCVAGYNGTYQSDKHYGSKQYSFSNRNRDVQADIMTNGPVVAVFTVYEDFLQYKSGVYKHLTGDVAGLHAVKIIGWGVESGVDYWLVANSWNPDWGNKGYFKIARGHDEGGIEGDIVAGLPKL